MGMGQVNTEGARLRSLLAAQAPQWADLPIVPVESDGTDNAMFRLGSDLALRLPRRPEAVPLLYKEALWVPKLSDLPLRVPVPRFLGAPSQDYPWPFAVVDWIEGAQAQWRDLTAPQQAVDQLADGLRALWEVPTEGAPLAGLANHNRGVALSQMDAQVRRDVAELSDELDVSAALSLWTRACAAPPATRSCWVHGDLKPDNMLMRGGHLVALIDWGLAAVGDPAADLALAWRWGEACAPLQRAFPDDEALWDRAAGWALYGACVALAYYRAPPGRVSTNPALCALCREVLGRLRLRRAWAS